MQNVGGWSENDDLFVQVLRPNPADINIEAEQTFTDNQRYGRSLIGAGGLTDDGRRLMRG
jgi:hypothetical protein